MKKMMSLNYPAFTPAYGSYAVEKVVTAEPVDGPTEEVACDGLHDARKTDLVVPR
jgi:hypothetical protein